MSLSKQQSRCAGVDAGPTDQFLVAGLVGGDDAALGVLMRRYDRLVRYVVFRAAGEKCKRDYLWLDAVASATWHGFVRSMQSADGQYPDSVRAYVVRIARNQAVSALRKDTSDVEVVSLNADDGAASMIDDREDPGDEMARLEQLEAVRLCLAELGEDDRTLAAQLPAITERRWREAAEALEMKESTLRSRWQGTLGRLRGCVEGKTRNNLAPGGNTSDS